MVLQSAPEPMEYYRCGGESGEPRPIPGHFPSQPFLFNRTAFI